MFKNVSRGIFTRKEKSSLLAVENIDRPLLHQITVKQRAQDQERAASSTPSHNHFKRKPQIIAVAGGKGGIGKSFLSANLSFALVSNGSKVALFDLDLGAANLHTCLGIPSPQLGVWDYLSKKVESIEEIATPSGMSGLTLYGGGQEFWQQIRPTAEQKIKLIQQFQEMDADYVILDLGAGTHTNTLDFFMFSHAGILVVLPEPTSIENAYVFLKSMLFRQMQSVIKEFDKEQECEKFLQTLCDPKSSDSPFTIVEKFAKKEPELGAKILEHIHTLKLGIVMNQVRNQADTDLGHSMAQICSQYFGFQAQYLGAVAFDDAVWKAIRSRKPFLPDHPKSLTARNIHNISRQIIDVFLPSRNIHRDKAG